MIDEDDFSMFEDGCDDADEIGQRTNILYVPGTVEKPEDLNLLEENYRRWSIAPIIFASPLSDEDPFGPETLDNSPEFCRLMGLPPDTPLTVQDAEDFIRRYTGANGEWLYFRLLEAVEAAGR
jgi:hypothetical protein